MDAAHGVDREAIRLLISYEMSPANLVGWERLFKERPTSDVANCNIKGSQWSAASAGTSPAARGSATLVVAGTRRTAVPGLPVAF